MPSETGPRRSSFDHADLDLHQLHPDREVRTTEEAAWDFSDSYDSSSAGPSKSPTLDESYQEARHNRRGRLTRRLGRLVTGKDSPVAIISGREASLARIKRQNTLEGSIDAARAELDRVQRSRRNKLATGAMRAVGRKGFVTKKEATLRDITAELETAHRRDHLRTQGEAIERELVG